jgi:purine nucleosidase
MDDKWVEQAGNSRKITVWENFNSEAIMADFYKTLEESQGVVE